MADDPNIVECSICKKLREKHEALDWKTVTRHSFQMGKHYATVNLVYCGSCAEKKLRSQA